MKKISSLIFILAVIAASVFAGRSRFYEKGKVIDSMYVVPLDGLKVRNSPDLKGNKIAAIPYMLQVKVVAIGKETRIDGINDPWVEILVPRYLWSGDEPEYGWVFGGYLTDKRDFSMDMPLELALQAHNWDSECGDKMKLDFCSEGFDSRTFYFSYDLGNGCRIEYRGKWTVRNNVLHMEGKYTFYDDGRIVLDEADYKVDMTKEDVRCGDISMGMKVFPIVGWPEIEMPYGYRSLLDSETLKELQEKKVRFFAVYCSENGEGFSVDFSKPHIYYRAWCDYDEEEKNLYCSPLVIFSDDEMYRHWVPSVIAAGVDPRMSDYVKEYREYWDPIMKDHQKKADEMK